MVQKMKTGRMRDSVTAIFVSFVLVFSAGLSVLSGPLTDHFVDAPEIEAAQPLPLTALPAGEGALLEPSDPDAEPSIWVWGVSPFPKVIAIPVVEERRCPGFPPLLERPPQA